MPLWMERLPKSLLVFLCLSVALLFIFILNPPHTQCDSQKNIFREKINLYLFLDPSKEYQKTTEFEKQFNQCRVGNSAVSCVALFEGMKDVLEELEVATVDCKPVLTSLNEVRESLFQLEELLLLLAWGDSTPESYLDRAGWLDITHLSVFCRSKEIIIEGLGKKSWEGFQERMLKILSGKDNKLSRKDIWSRSLLSLNCQRFL